MVVRCWYTDSAIRLPLEPAEFRRIRPSETFEPIHGRCAQTRWTAGRSAGCLEPQVPEPSQRGPTSGLLRRIHTRVKCNRPADFPAALKPQDEWNWLNQYGPALAFGNGPIFLRLESCPRVLGVGAARLRPGSPPRPGATRPMAGQESTAFIW